MTSSRTGACPDQSALMNLDLNPADGDHAEIELHIESCEHCQQILQELASKVSRELEESHGLRQSSDAIPEIPGFRIVEELGRGGESIVLLAEDLRTSRLVAIKLIATDRPGISARRARWLDEVRTAARMQHHNIVRLYQVEETPKWFLLIFEYVSGGTLRSWLDCSIQQAQLARLLHTIAIAVQKIHEQGFLHLDLKPSNILIDDSAGTDWNSIVPKVSDFGIAVRHQPDEGDPLTTRHGRGTPAYMAPEQISDHAADLSPATDVYGLGGILFTMLTGVPPFQGDTPEDTLRNVLTTPVSFPSQSVRPQMDELVAVAAKCLEKHPANRYQTPEALAAALEPLFAETSSSTLNARSRWLPARLILATTGLLIAAYLLTQTLRHDPDRTTITQQSQNAVRAAVADQNIAGAVSLPKPSSADLQPSEHPAQVLSLNQWLDELALEPAAFDAPRANMLVVASDLHTHEILRNQSTATDVLLRYGILQLQAAARLAESQYVDFYPAAGELMENAVLLLEQVTRIDENNNDATIELVAARFLQSQLRPSRVHASASDRLQDSRRQLNVLAKTADDVRRISDLKQQVLWTSRILDHFRLTSWNAHWRGDIEIAQEVDLAEADFWKQLSVELTQPPDLSVRHALTKPQVELNGWPEIPEDGWMIPENLRLLKRELIHEHLGQQFWAEFQHRIQLNAAARSDDLSDFLKMLDQTIEFQHQRLLEVSLLPSILNQEFVRPATGIGAALRTESKLDEAECLQRMYQQLCDAAKVRFPNNAEVSLAACEADLQKWKNELRRGRKPNAVKALEESLARARTALVLAPDSVEARLQVADRIKRLTRALSEDNERRSPPP